jgi:hypothetical protein
MDFMIKNFIAFKKLSLTNALSLLFFAGPLCAQQAPVLSKKTQKRLETLEANCQDLQKKYSLELTALSKNSFQAQELIKKAALEKEKNKKIYLLTYDQTLEKNLRTLKKQIASVKRRTKKLGTNPVLEHTNELDTQLTALQSALEKDDQYKKELKESRRWSTTKKVFVGIGTGLAAIAVPLVGSFIFLFYIVGL